MSASPLTPNSAAATRWYLSATEPVCAWTHHADAPLLLNWRYRKTGWLWLWLCSRRGHALSRGELASSLWPEAQAVQARNNLRVLLADLLAVWKARGLPAHAWAIERDTLSLRWLPELITELDPEPHADGPSAWLEHLAQRPHSLAIAAQWGDTLPSDVGPSSLQLRERLRQQLGAPAATPPARPEGLAPAAPEPPAPILSETLRQALQSDVHHLVLVRIEPDIPIDADDSADPVPDPHSGRSAWRRALPTIAALARTHGASIESADDWGTTLVLGLASPHAAQRWRALDLLERIDAALPADVPTLRAAALQGRHAIHTWTAQAVGVAGGRTRLLQSLTWWSEPGHLACPASWADLLEHCSGFALCSTRFRDTPTELQLCTVPLASLRHGLLPVGTGPKAPPFVGRQAELEQLHAIWRDCRAQQQRHIVVLQAPLGHGKTRLAAEFARRIASQGAQLWWLSGQPELTHLPWQALHQTLARHWQSLRLPEPDVSTLARLGVRVNPAQAQALQRLIQDATVAQTDLDALAHALAAWWSASDPDANPPGPTLLVIDDIQWADAASVLMVRRALSLCPALMVLLTQRSAHAEATAGAAPPPWNPTQAERCALRILPLPPLGPTDARALVAAIEPAEPRDAAELHRRVELARGIPLLLLSAADARLAPAGSAMTEHCEAWINLLPQHRSSLRMAARLGMRFAVRDLASLIGEEPALAAARAALRNGLCLQRDPGHLAFFHPALREHLLASASASQTLQENERCAQHFHALGDLPRAAAHWIEARQLPAARHALLHAMRQAQQRDDLDACLALALRLSDIGYPDGTPGLQARVLHIRALLSRHGYAHPQAHQLASSLHSQLQAQPHGIDAELRYHSTAFQYLHDSGLSHHSGLRAAERMQALADSPAAQFVADWAMANGHFWLGRLQQANPWYQRVIDRAPTLSRAERERYFPSDASVFSTLQWAWGQWMLGHTDACLQAMDRIAALVGEPEAKVQDQVIYHTLAMLLSELTGQPQARQHHARWARERAEAEGFEFWLAFSDSYCALLDAEAGRPFDLQALHARHQPVLDNYPSAAPVAWWLAARALRAAGQIEPALSLIDAALGRMQTDGGSILWGDALWLRAQLLDTLGQPTAAQGARSRAIAAAEDARWAGWLRHHLG